jgi:hypothetical protein
VQPLRRGTPGTATTEYVIILALVLGMVLLVMWKTVGSALLEKINTTFEVKKKEPEKEEMPKKPIPPEAPASSGWFSGGGSGGRSRSSPIPIESTGPINTP